MFMRVDQLQTELPPPTRADPNAAAALQELLGDPPGDLVVVEGMPEGGKIHDLTGEPNVFTPDYAPEEMFEIAEHLTRAAMQGAGSL